ncbi:hypothetical protein [Limimaricola litoreus]|uniref:Uncharacterized protein n=1 Tax=Limimaricola litoreus TaxID=2955316 RepID=A0A9X2JT90_9RHOB|nr:hypothetical protein [Limimaricola litoreus]MCP1170506.1 hypothetical protein [Limimaricola litoreus]
MTATLSTRSDRAPLVLGGGRRTAEGGLVLALFAVWAFALGVTAAAGALWLSPLGAPGDAALWAKLALAVLLGGGLICFAGLGSRSEMHFDTERRLVREVLRRPGGRVQQVASWRFDEFRATEIRDHRDPRRMALRAELRLSGENVSVRVAKGELHVISALARRIETDLDLPRRRGVPLFRRAA